jgi:hypothetical protein
VTAKTPHDPQRRKADRNVPRPLGFWRVYAEVWREVFGLCWRRSRGVFVLICACMTLDTFAITGIGLAMRAIVSGTVNARGAEIFCPGGITVIVSHRFSTVAGADLILVLEAGRLVEAGSHEELLAAGSTYAELYSIQQTAYSPTPR